MRALESTQRGWLRFGKDDEGDRMLMLGFVALTEKEIEDGVARLPTALKR